MKLDKDLTKKYPSCLVEYRPIVGEKEILGIECVGDTHSEFGEIEKRVDIQRAKRAGCRGAEQICDWLNGRR